MSVDPAGTASKDAGFHHLVTNSRPWYKNPRQFPLSDLSRSKIYLKDRYSSTESLRRAFVCQLQLSKIMTFDPLQIDHLVNDWIRQ